MKRILIAAMLVAAPAFAAENPAATKPADAIKAVFAQVDACIANSDATCFGELFAADATLISPIGGAKLVKGKAEIVNLLRTMMGAPNMKDVQQKHVVQNVRVIGQDHAFVDCSVDFIGIKGPVSADGRLQTWHVTGLMVLKGGKWLIEDIRSYAVEPERPPTPVPTVAPTPPAQSNVGAQSPVPTPAAQPNVPALPAAPPKF